MKKFILILCLICITFSRHLCPGKNKDFSLLGKKKEREPESDPISSISISDPRQKDSSTAPQPTAERTCINTFLQKYEAFGRPKSYNEYKNIKVQTVGTIHYRSEIELDCKFYHQSLKNQRDFRIGNGGIAIALTEDDINEKDNDKEVDVFRYGRDLTKPKYFHSDPEIITYLESIKNPKVIYLSTYFSPCITCIDKLYSEAKLKNISIFIFYIQYYSAIEAEKDSGYNLSRFLSMEKETLFASLYEDKGLKKESKYQITNGKIKRKYEKIVKEGEGNTNFFKIQHITDSI